jgi:hypothetical protein
MLIALLLLVTVETIEEGHACLEERDLKTSASRKDELLIPAGVIEPPQELVNCPVCKRTVPLWTMQFDARSHDDGTFELIGYHTRAGGLSDTTSVASDLRLCPGSYCSMAAAEARADTDFA